MRVTLDLWDPNQLKGSGNKASQIYNTRTNEGKFNQYLNDKDQKSKN